jgi:membrane-bound lytic murein transglycosylase MltF
MSRPRRSQLLIWSALIGAILVAGCAGPEVDPAAEGLTPTGVSDEASPDEVEPPPQIEEPVAIVDIDNPWLRLRHVSPWTGDLDGMVERSVVRYLVVQSRTWFFLDGARQRGLAVEAAKALETFLNERLKEQGDRVQVLIIPVRRDQLLPALVQGLGDVAGGNLTITPQRRELVDFTNPWVSDVKELVVTGPSTPPIETVEELAGREIWVRGSSSYYESLRRLNEEFPIRGFPEIRIRKADENLEDEDILEMVQAGLLPATVVDSHKLDWVWADVFDKLVVHPGASIREGGQIGTAVRKNSPQLLASVNDFIASHGVGTTFGNRMIKRYFSKRQWLRDLGASSEVRKFDAVDELFQRYATRYDFDYLMLMAQGYQESLLDQKARSPVGAVGIMQLLPSTAKGYPVSIPNVEETEPNIHAGIKYLRFIVDEHLDDPGIDPVNRLLFAFASYNAGPNRIDRIRRQAEAHGFDPNQWFREVELLVAAEVGREPVLYVRNIYKYYLAYTEIRNREAERRRAKE